MAHYFVVSGPDQSQSNESFASSVSHHLISSLSTPKGNKRRRKESARNEEDTPNPKNFRKMMFPSIYSDLPKLTRGNFTE